MNKLQVTRIGVNRLCEQTQSVMTDSVAIFCQVKLPTDDCYF